MRTWGMIFVNTSHIVRNVCLLILSTFLISAHKVAQGGLTSSHRPSSRLMADAGKEPLMILLLCKLFSAALRVCVTQSSTVIADAVATLVSVSISSIVSVAHGSGTGTCVG